MRTALVLDALEQAIWTRHRGGASSMAGLICHHDAGSQYTSIAFTERLAAAGAQPSVGSVGDAYDNALAESVIGLYKTELINPRGPWRTAEQVEVATRHDPLDLDRGAGFGFGQRRWPGGPRPGGYQLGQVGGGQVGADRLDPQPACGQVDHVGVGPEGDDPPGAAGPSQNWRPVASISEGVNLPARSSTPPAGRCRSCLPWT
jgi:transposase InsO family protein